VGATLVFGVLFYQIRKKYISSKQRKWIVESNQLLVRKMYLFS
jgi:hypothetical protein